MGKIFSGATQVIIWLGTLPEDGEPALKFLVDLAGHYDEVSDQLDPDSGSREIDIAGHLLGTIQDRYNETIVPLCSLLSLPWWGRLWVQQEVSLPHIDKIFMVCGDTQILWKTAVLAQSTIWHLVRFTVQGSQGSTAQPPERTHDIGATLAWCSQMMFQTCRNSYHQIWSNPDRSKVSLVDRLWLNATSRSGHMEASLAIDHIYALLGISTDVPIQPDYSRLPRDVFVDVAQYVLEKLGAWMLLLCDASRANRFDLPSWVPDWSRASLVMPLSPRDTGQLAHHRSSLFRAKGDACDFRFEVSGFKLHLHGSYVDTIDGDGIMDPILPRPDTVASRYMLNAFEWLTAFNAISYDKFVSSHKSLEATLWRISIADQDISPGGVIVRAQPSLRMAFEELMTHIQSNDRDVLSADAVRYQRIMESVSTTRVTFKSSSSFVGLGSRAVQSGDKIFIVLGMDVPIVLRDAGDGEYCFIGEAYVHGIMDGEFMTKAPIIESLTIV